MSQALWFPVTLVCWTTTITVVDWPSLTWRWRLVTASDIIYIPGGGIAPDAVPVPELRVDVQLSLARPAEATVSIDIPTGGFASPPVQTVIDARRYQAARPIDDGPYVVGTFDPDSLPRAPSPLPVLSDAAYAIKVARLASLKEGFVTADDVRRP
jgi:hypothetical protein